MYSQNDEEKVILNYFKDHNSGTFLDLGANDGQTFSNTRALALIGWRGVFVEPSPNAFHKLKTLYSESSHYLLNIAIGPIDGPVEFHESGSLINDNDTGLVSTIKKSELKRFNSFVGYEKIEVDCMTWRTFFKISPLKLFDFISIDIEGAEMDVLQHIDLSSTKLICVEWNGIHNFKINIEPLMEGFKLIHVTGENLIYGR